MQVRNVWPGIFPSTISPVTIFNNRWPCTRNVLVLSGLHESSTILSMYAAMSVAPNNWLLNRRITLRRLRKLRPCNSSKFSAFVAATIAKSSVSNACSKASHEITMRAIAMRKSDGMATGRYGFLICAGSHKNNMGSAEYGSAIVSRPRILLRKQNLMHYIEQNQMQLSFVRRQLADMSGAFR